MIINNLNVSPATSFQSENSHVFAPVKLGLRKWLYIWISGTGWIGVHNAVFSVIKCEVLYLNENIMFRLNLLAYSQHVLHISFAP